jgi:hypothetical protein
LTQAENYATINVQFAYRAFLSIPTPETEQNLRISLASCLESSVPEAKPEFIQDYGLPSKNIVGDVRTQKHEKCKQPYPLLQGSAVSRCDDPYNPNPRNIGDHQWILLISNPKP